MPGANQYAIGVSVDSTKAYSIVVANWPDPASVDSGVSHVDPAESLLVMAKNGEVDGGLLDELSRSAHSMHLRHPMMACQCT